MKKVKGNYYGVDFTGIIEREDPNWENGSFEKSHGIHILVELDAPLNGYKVGNHIMNDNRKNLSLHGWVNNQTFHWGFCQLVD